MSLFEKFKPGVKAPETGIYMCENCGELIALAQGERLPPCRCGAPTWILVLLAGKAGEVYEIGTESPVSGLFICMNCKKEIIPLAKGEKFPPCRTCGEKTKWRVIVRV